MSAPYGLAPRRGRGLNVRRTYEASSGGELSNSYTVGKHLPRLGKPFAHPWSLPRESKGLVWHDDCSSTGMIAELLIVALLILGDILGWKRGWREPNK